MPCVGASPWVRHCPAANGTYMIMAAACARLLEGVIPGEEKSFNTHKRSIVATPRINDMMAGLENNRVVHRTKHGNTAV